MGENKDAHQRSMNLLENYVKNNKIFIDTCSLLHPDIDKFWENIEPFLEKYDNYVIDRSTRKEGLIISSYGSSL